MATASRAVQSSVAFRIIPRKPLNGRYEARRRSLRVPQVPAAVQLHPLPRHAPEGRQRMPLVRGGTGQVENRSIILHGKFTSKEEDMAKWHPSTRLVACDGLCEQCSGSCSAQLELWPKPKKMHWLRQIWEDIKFPWSRERSK